jgi:M3 family oligoendopeptidase
MDKFTELEYKRPDFDAAQKALAELTQRAANAKDYTKLRKVIVEQDDLMKDINFNCMLATIRCYLDSSDAFYVGEMQYDNQQCAMLDDTQFTKALLESPFLCELENDLGVAFLQKQRDAIRLTANGRELMAKEQELIAKYQQLCATLKVRFDGRELSEGEMYQYITSTDRNVRREAGVAVRMAYVEHCEEFEDILDGLVETRIALAKANGFERYTDYINLQQGRHGYGQEELISFCRQVKDDLLPLYAKLNRQQSKRLGLEKMSRYDVNVIFPDGNAKPLGDGQYLMERAKEMYDQLDDEIAGLYRQMADYGYIDVTSSPNKISGMGFCMSLYTLKFPYVFGNCDGSIGDATVLTHEIGHSYQQWLCMNHHHLSAFCEMPNDAIEIPSKAMEQFTAPFGELFFDDAYKFRYNQLQYMVREICAFCATCEFEDWLYSNPKATNKQRNEKYMEITEGYAPEIDWSELMEPISKGSELFSDKGVYMFPGYVISYALSDMCALVFKLRAQEDFKATWKDYRALCMAGGSLDYQGLMEVAHLSTAYAPGTVAKAAQCLDKAFGELEK